MRDARSAGKSVIVPFVRDEPAADRHERRLRANLEARDQFAATLARAGFAMAIKNEGQHWIIRNGVDAWEWWPSSAKFVKNKQWRKGVHCHDYQQVLRELGIEGDLK